MPKAPPPKSAAAAAGGRPAPYVHERKKKAVDSRPVSVYSMFRFPVFHSAMSCVYNYPPVQRILAAADLAIDGTPVTTLAQLTDILKKQLQASARDRTTAFVPLVQSCIEIGLRITYVLFECTDGWHHRPSPRTRLHLFGYSTDDGTLILLADLARLLTKSDTFLDSDERLDFVADDETDDDDFEVADKHVLRALLNKSGLGFDEEMLQYSVGADFPMPTVRLFSTFFSEQQRLEKSDNDASWEKTVNDMQLRESERFRQYLTSHPINHPTATVQYHHADPSEDSMHKKQRRILPSIRRIIFSVIGQAPAANYKARLQDFFDAFSQQ